MKKILIAILIFNYINLIGQNAEAPLENVDISTYCYGDETKAIEAFDAEYNGKTIQTISEPASLFSNKRYRFVKNLLVKHKVKPVNFLDVINASNWICGVGLKRVKDVSTACKQSLVYVENEESKIKMELAELIINQGEKPSIDAFRGCVYKNEFALFKLFTKVNGGLVDTKSCEEMLVEAADYGHIDIIKFLLDNNISANATQTSTFYALFRAVKYPEIFFLLIEKGADYNIVGYSETTTIIHAAREGCTEVLQFLIDKGINPEEKHGNLNAIEMAKKFNKKNGSEVVKLLKTYKPKAQ
jgi:ankyrin repeat protein